MPRRHLTETWLVLGRADPSGVAPERAQEPPRHALRVEHEVARINARFATPVQLYCEYLQEGPLSAGARLDSVLHLQECAYRWRPLRRERYAAG